MRKAIYAGTFDPITNGHLDLIQRAADLFDEILVAVSSRPNKATLFSASDRLKMVQESIRDLKGVKAKLFSGLLADFVSKTKAVAIIRGLRAVSDFEYEFQMALMNRKLAPGIETVFLMPSEKYTYLSSTLIKEIARNKGEISSFVPEIVATKLRKKFGVRK
ncbi:MAG: pantetheine-phosphate adenylyltransferase [candidate division Zixibacteria bacterium]|jgi:pantetheine-phosphate adenylyltransferase|nr:pantetheine-phosphate adenylyltransferase [candidate division Zixibacteria bacterium]